MAEKKGNSKERRKEILSYLSMAGGFGIPNSVIRGLTERFGVSERQIYKDIEVVLQSVTMPEIEKLSKKFALSFEINMRTVHRLVISQDPYIQAKGIGLLNQTILSFTEFLEKFGLKDKIANILEISEGGVSKETFEVYKDLAEDYLAVFDKRREEERKLEEILKNKLSKELFEEVMKEIGNSIYHTNRTIDMIAVKDKEGIIDHVIRIVSPGDEQIRKERQARNQETGEGFDAQEDNSTNN